MNTDLSVRPKALSSLWRPRCLLGQLLFAAVMTAAAPAQCTPQWLPGDGFDMRGGSLLQAEVTRLMNLPGGDLYARGRFDVAGGIAGFQGLGRWDDGAWTPFPFHLLGVMPNGDLLGVNPLNSGDLQRWNGSAWVSLGGGVSNQGTSTAAWVGDVAILPTGDLIVCGSFNRAGAIPAQNIARWNEATSTWSSLGNGIGTPFSWVVKLPAVDSSGVVYAIHVPSPLVLPVEVYRWDGTAWSIIGSVVGNGRPHHVLASALLPNGSLVIGGIFDSVSGVSCSSIAKWDGAAWSGFGAGATLNSGFQARVYSLLVLASGELLAGGVFDSVQGVAARSIARWDTTAWHPLGLGTGGTTLAEVLALVERANGEVVAGGRFVELGGLPATAIARFGCATNLATSAVTGTGCYAVPNGTTALSYYEHFATGPFDLSNATIAMTPSGYSYSVTTTFGTPAFLNPPSSSNLGLDDDSCALVSLGFTFPYPGGTSTDVLVGSNGYVLLETSNWDILPFYGNVSHMLQRSPRLAPMWGDLDPGPFTGGGTVHADFDPVNQRAYFTWLNVQEFNAPSTTCTFQVMLDSTGAVEFRYLGCAMAAAPVLTGWSPGGNAQDPGTRDLSASGTFVLASGPLTLAATSRPGVGGTWRFETQLIPATGVLGLEILGRSNPNIPDLAAYGMPGCGQYSSLDAVGLFTPIGPTHAWSFAVPNAPWLFGLRIFATSAVATTAPVNPLGVVTSNGLVGVVGRM